MEKRGRGKGGEVLGFFWGGVNWEIYNNNREMFIGRGQNNWLRKKKYTAKRCYGGGVGDEIVTSGSRFFYIKFAKNNEIMNFWRLVKSTRPLMSPNLLSNNFQTFWHISSLSKPTTKHKHATLTKRRMFCVFFLISPSDSGSTRRTGDTNSNRGSNRLAS